jgi:ABC-2 type transport system permease protein
MIRHMLLYILSANFIKLLLDNDIALDVSDLIQEGLLAASLVKPMNPMLGMWAKDLGEVVSRLIAEGIILVFVALCLAGFSPLDFTRLAVFIILMFLGYCFSSMLYVNLGCLAFIFDSVRPFNTCMYYIVNLLGGELFPVSFYPDYMIRVIRYLPFRYLFDYPILVLISDEVPNMREAATACVTLASWTLALAILFRLIYRRSIKYASFYGG